MQAYILPEESEEYQGQDDTAQLLCRNPAGLSEEQREG